MINSTNNISVPLAFGNLIRASLMLRGMNMRQWAKQHGHHYQTVYEVVNGLSGYGRQNSKAHAVMQDLKRDGLWPEVEEVEP